MNCLDLMQKRRSCYQLTDKLPVPRERVEEIVAGCVKYAPSAFNSQSARVVLLFGARHKKLWEIVKETLCAVVPPEKFAPTEEKINAFALACGTILYYEDAPTVQALQEQYPAYRDNFPVWAQQSNGMLQFAVWTALAEAGVGASLQHYNPLIDNRVAQEFDIPASWALVAQMPFGQPAAAPQDKTFLPLTQRIKVQG